MNTKRKYPKVTGSWTYGHIVPENLIYIGRSDEPECCNRWKPSRYNGTELQPYIEKYGWNNIKHIVFKDGLTPKQAEQLEGLLIAQAKIDGWCINKRNSGGECRDNPAEYNHKNYLSHRKEVLERSKQYYSEHKEQKKDWLKKYTEEHREQRREWEKKSKLKQHSTPEGKIYNRVNAFNQKHPDLKIETALEAKQKYLETGYIPNYIKNNDLF